MIVPCERRLPVDRIESFPVSAVSGMALRLAWGALDVAVDDNAGDVQVTLSGDESAVEAVTLRCDDGFLTLRQPLLPPFRRSLRAQVLLPRTWKGALSASTVAAPLNASGVTGTDLQLTTVTGALRAEALGGITVALRTVTGEIDAEALLAGQLALRSVTGDITLSGVDARQITLRTVAGNTYAEECAPFDRMDAVTVSGDLHITAPEGTVSARLRSLRRRPGNHPIEHTPAVRMTSVAGDLEINQPEDFEEE